jgi:putative oxygen-independent coproporphyrinogen III oxidase
VSGPRESSAAAGVYVHVPYCRRRCAYCDFYFEVRPADAAFADAVVDELSARRDEIPWPARTLSFGGGTPTALPAAQLARIGRAVTDAGLAPGAEISLEVNPEDVDDRLADALASAGFTRASVGVQSFQPDMLAYLGRAHDADRAHASVQSLVRAGLDVGVDLIVGVPGESPARIASDVARARALGVVHVSTYLLTVESGTGLEQLITLGKRAAVDDDAQADAYAHVQTTLAAHGFAQYEVSSFAQPGKESVHNRLYWAHAPYLGLGPGAHSMRLLADGGVARRHTTARLDGYLAGARASAHEDEELAPAHALLEGVAFGLRDLAAGVDVAALASLHRVPDPAFVVRALAPGQARGHVERRGDRFALTALGARFADGVARDVLAAMPTGR